MMGPSNKLALRIKMSARYVAHLPMFVEVTLANPATSAEEYVGLITCNPWAPPFPVEFAFSSGARKVPLPARSDVGWEEAAHRFNLPPGQARTCVLDLSELDTPIPPGAWHCTAGWLMRVEHPRWAGASVTIAAAPAADLPLIDRLRVLRRADSASWANFLEDRDAIHSPELRGLSAESRRALAPYSTIHRAIHGPQPLAKFPLEQLSELRSGPWASEAAVLEYELAWARHAAHLTELRSSILASWPGVTYRLDEVEKGAGYLTALRDRVGPDSGEGR
ncbi:MAG TPA: hypothetical protein VN962_22180 [Polyangia bacterium]|nr:hypothetical protein [Polyangia bacterium]